MGSKTSGAVKNARRYRYSPAIEKMKTAASCRAYVPAISATTLSRCFIVRRSATANNTSPPQGAHRIARCWMEKSYQAWRCLRSENFKGWTLDMDLVYGRILLV